MIDIIPEKLPRHVAVIMDGNGRWAKQRGLSRIKGHQKGADVVRAVVETSRELGIPWLTLYAFSEENWKRSAFEVKTLMQLLERFLKEEVDGLMKHKIRLNCIGRPSRLPNKTRKALESAIDLTKANNEMVLTLALSYGGRQEITDAVRSISKLISSGNISPEDISEDIVSRHLYTSGTPDPDLLIRTGGEYRVSNFLLWQIAYTEFYVTKVYWPDFDKKCYMEALQDFQRRERRFGAVFD
ncbi:MAG: isoprenyl transferase [Deltaproteobacteria bacterium CG_4_8_14_3_um_filter_51_11]|nr:isoprenyl transferase [bacterium]OIP42429.1 MAG: di-trans,poly-cis-decaprenylcistransferase [Desulfobacteraceae bacterium CG2_30_51_40]PIW00686.1 MAG: isoprenyl transferase [Deltaproteobacteria bacterium CG17_big_fil_post_rev_8_21_14_2_50_51_6]PIX18481.1 MAG: isoprenyl transferase [Deltaproteobacteria bacterium CG_4_8_14_3_um_filter_51_11]PIY22588.1 MAG: isoprenyl transferase [Deltaproteobacteria bacterium CG_4_10_14_3_um_filter_51_14]